jgi:hypothetical protein
MTLTATNNTGDVLTLEVGYTLVFQPYETITGLDPAVATYRDWRQAVRSGQLTVTIVD